MAQFTDDRLQSCNFDVRWAKDVAVGMHIAPGVSTSLIAAGTYLGAGVDGLAYGLPAAVAVYGLLLTVDRSFLRTQLRGTTGLVTLAARVVVPLLCGTFASLPVLSSLLSADIARHQAETVRNLVETRRAAIVQERTPAVVRLEGEFDRLDKQNSGERQSALARIGQLRKNVAGLDEDIAKAQAEFRMFETRAVCEVNGLRCDATSTGRPTRGTKAILAETMRDAASRRVADLVARRAAASADLATVLTANVEAMDVADARQRLADERIALRSALVAVEEERAVREVRAELGPIAKAKIVYRLVSDDRFILGGLILAKAFLVTLELLGILLGASFATASKIGRDHRVQKIADDADATALEAVHGERLANAGIRVRQAAQRLKEATYRFKASVRAHRLQRVFEDVEILRNLRRKS